MKLLVGLGNPGKKYTGNRHNIGFMAVEEIARAHGFAPWRSRFKGEVSEGLINSKKCLLLKPHTYMNLSGDAVHEAAQFYKIPNQDIIVLHDEIDLAPGKIKVKSGGGNAGHNGLKSISQHMDNDYIRVRLGVGRPADKGDVANYVLRDFAKAEADWLDDLLRAVARHAGYLIDDDNSGFMSHVGQDLRPSGNEKSDQNPDKSEEKPRGKQARVDDKTAGKESRGASTDKKGALGAALAKWLKKGDGQDGV